jgi:hypothetical protein
MKIFTLLVGLLAIGCATPKPKWEPDPPPGRMGPLNWPTNQREPGSQDPKLPPNMYPGTSGVYQNGNAVLVPTPR